MSLARRVLAGAASIAAIASLACGPPGAGAPSPGRFTDPREERVLLTTFDRIDGVAVSRRHVFALGRSSLAVYDRQFREWLAPFALEERGPFREVAVMAADPMDDAVWIATPGLVRFVRLFPAMGSSAIVPGTPTAIVFDARNPTSGAFVFSGGGWVLVSRSGAAVRVSAQQVPPPAARIVAPTLRTLLDQYPSLRSFASLLTRDAQLRSWPITAGSSAPDESEVWLGTRGGGLFRVDPVFNRSEQVEYGLLSEGAGALARIDGGIAIAGLGLPGSAGGITLVTEDLQRWSWIEGGPTRPLAGARAYDMAIAGDAIWVGTSRGVARLDARAENDVRLWSDGRGLPSRDALAIAATPMGAWVGTARGLVFIRDDGSRQARAEAVGEPIGPAVPVRALALAGDTLWMGTDAGLLALTADAPEPRRPTATNLEPRLSRAILALAIADSVLVILTRQDILVMHRRTGEIEPALWATAPSLVDPSGVSADSRSIWVTGARGVVIFQRGSALTRVLGAPGQIPGAAYDVLLDASWAWIATREGVFRMRRTSDGMPR